MDKSGDMDASRQSLVVTRDLAKWRTKSSGLRTVSLKPYKRAQCGHFTSKNTKFHLPFNMFTSKNM